MSLISFEYLVFFTIVVAVFFVVPNRFRWLYLLVASYFFYMWWDPKYALLILTTTIIVYGTALIMHNRSLRVKKLCVALSLISNLGILFIFKYYVFFTTNVQDLLGLFGVNYSAPVLRLLLPVGLSFYTFQALSYTIDVYRGTREPERHFGMFALYVSFFPTLLSGPIERSTRLLPQLYRKVEFNYDRAVSGLVLMGWGFFQKLVIADRLAQYVNLVFSVPQFFKGLPLVLAAYFFNIQVYCDFSGYTDIAIGTAMVMGYELMPNFRRPFFAKNIGDFWRRWHISLISWFRDYLYIPLGGNKVSKARWYFNTLLVFTVSGLWHGAQWTYVVWGALNGVFLIVSRRTERLRAIMSGAFFGTAAKVPPAVYFALFFVCVGLSALGGVIGIGLGSRIGSGAAAVVILPVAIISTRKEKFIRFIGKSRNAWMAFATFNLFALGCTFFRAKSLTDAWYMVTHFPGTNVLHLPLIFGFQDLGLMFLSVIVLLVVHSIQERHGSIREMIRTKPLIVRWIFYYLLAMTILYGMQKSSQFIYFQF